MLTMIDKHQEHTTHDVYTGMRDVDQWSQIINPHLSRRQAQRCIDGRGESIVRTYDKTRTCEVTIPQGGDGSRSELTVN